MKHINRISSLLLTAAMLFTAFVSVSAADGDTAANYQFWNEELYFINFNGVLEDFHNTSKHADKTKPIFHAGNSCGAIVDIQAPPADSDVRETSLKFNNTSNASLALTPNEAQPLPTGVYKIRFSLLANGACAGVNMGGSAENAAISMAYIDQDGSVLVGGTNAKVGQAPSGNSICTVDPQKWVDFEEILSVADKKLYLKVTQGESTTEKIIENIKCLSGNELTDSYAIKRFGIKQYVMNAPSYFDDLFVEMYTGDFPVITDPDEPDPPTPPDIDPSEQEDKLLMDLDFSGNTEEEAMSRDYGYRPGNIGALFMPRTEDDSRGNCLCFPKNITAISGCAFAFSAAEKEPKAMLRNGVYKFSFSIYSNGDTPVVCLDAGSASKYVPLAYVSGGTARHANIADTSSDTVICKGLSENDWIDFETVVDLDNSRVCYTIAQNGAVKANKVTVPLTSQNGDIWSDVYQFSRIAVRTANNSKNGFYFDDLKMYKCGEFPTIGDKFITITDALGNVSLGVDKQELLPAVHSITLNFGCDVDADSVNEISVSPSVGFTHSVQGAECILTFDELLSDNTEYILTVPENIKLYSGSKTLGKEYSLRFKTGAARTVTVLSYVEKDGKKLEGVSGLKAGDKINVKTNTINMSGTDMNFTIVTAYYKGNKMLAADFCSRIVPNKKALEDAEFTVPSEAAEMTAMRCFMWNDTDKPAAYCEHMEIGAPSPAGSGEEATAQSGNKIPVKVEYDRSENKALISGKAESGEYIVLQALKTGKKFGDVLSEDDIMYLNQTTARNGEFSFEIEFDNTDEGNHTAMLSTNGDTEPALFYLNLITAQNFAKLYDELGQAAAHDSENDFAQKLNENLYVLGFDFELTEGRTLTVDEIRNYIDYVKANPLNVSEDIRNRQIFKTYITAYDLNAKSISSIDSFADQLYFESENTLGEYHKLASGNVEQTYFAKKLHGRNIGNLQSFNNEFKRALIYTAVRYGDGSDDVRNALTSYGSLIGINDTADGKVYGGLLGNDYGTDGELLNAYNSLKKQCSSDNNTGSNRLGGGGGGTTGYKAENIYQAAPQKIAVAFQDIEGFDWATEAILALADRGIINGTEAGKFEPDREVTREEFTKILIGAMGLSDVEFGGNAFTDVADNAWYAKCVNIARERGIVKGIGGNKFGAGQTVTREDIATMLYNALEYKKIFMHGGTPAFEDVSDIADYARDAVYALHELGAVNGVSDTEFNPKGNATRAQAAKMIYGVLNYLQ